MHPEERSKLNQRAVAMSRALGLDQDIYRQMILNVAPKSEGHITHCDDEEANLVVMALRKALDRRAVSTTRPTKARANERQHRQIARLMDYLDWHWGNTAKFVRQQTDKSNTFQCSAHELSIVIRGMVAIIDGDLKTGKLKLSDSDLQDYLDHTKKFRKSIPSPSMGEGKGEGDIVPAPTVGTQDIVSDSTQKSGG